MNANANASEIMAEGKNRVIAVVDDAAKKALVTCQSDWGYRTRDEAVERILHEYPVLRARVAELEADRK